MSTQPVSWLRARALWAGISIIIMWLAVLFVGVFGEDIVSSTPGGTTTSLPVVVALLPFVLPATIVVARRGFTETPETPQPEQDEGKGTEPVLRSTRRAG